MIIEKKGDKDLEEKYLRRLEELEFRGELNKCGTVLAMRAYHNDYMGEISFTDSSYIELFMPACFDEETERVLTERVTKLLAIYHQVSSAEELPLLRRAGGALQIEFKGALTKEQLVAAFLNLLDKAQEGLAYMKTKVTGDQKKQDALLQIEKRLEVLRVFVLAGRVTYEYIEQCYDPFE